MRQYKRKLDEYVEQHRNLEKVLSIQYLVQGHQHGKTRKEKKGKWNQMVEERRNEEGTDAVVSKVKNLAERQKTIFEEEDKRKTKAPTETYETEYCCGPLIIARVVGKKGVTIKDMLFEANKKGKLVIETPAKESESSHCMLRGDTRLVIQWKYYLEKFYGEKKYWQYQQHRGTKRSDAINPYTGKKLHTDWNCDYDGTDGWL